MIRALSRLLRQIGEVFSKMAGDVGCGLALLCGDRMYMEPDTMALSAAKALALVGNYPLAAPTLTAEALANTVAEAAYYRAEQRGFAEGDELYDWLEAEKDILNRFG